MKSVLLLAAVYSLIIHQWHKEKGTALAKFNEDRSLIVKKNESEKKDPVRFTTASQFLSLYSILRNE